MSQGHIIGPRPTRRGNAWLLKFELPRAPGIVGRNTRYKTVHCQTKTEARQELRRTLLEVDRGTYADSNKIPLKVWVEEWLKLIFPDVSAKTFERYAELLRLHVLPTFGDFPIQKITGVQIQALYSQLRSGEGKTRKLSAMTVLHVHRVFGQCMREAVRKRLLTRSPLEDVRAPRPNADRASSELQNHGSNSFRALTPEKLSQLLKGFRDHPLFPIVFVAAATGMRRGEILGLRWSDVDFEKGILRIDRSVEDTNSMGIRFKAPKNKGSRRSIGIDPGLVLVLQRYKNDRIGAFHRLGVEFGEESLLFPRSFENAEIPYAPRNLSKIFIKKARALGFSGLRFHDLRHTHATILLANGIPVNAVAARLGHSSPVITLNTYGHILQRTEDLAVEVAGQLFQGLLN